jgi:hypothetical protein
LFDLSLVLAGERIVFLTLLRFSLIHILTFLFPPPSPLSSTNLLLLFPSGLEKASISICDKRSEWKVVQYVNVLFAVR